MNTKARHPSQMPNKKDEFGLTVHEKNFAEKLAKDYAENLGDWAERQMSQGKTIEEIIYTAYLDGFVNGLERERDRENF